MGRAELLAKDDRELIEAVFVRGQSSESVARMMGVRPREVRRRLYSLARRLASRRFLNAARALPYLRPADADLARLRFCQGVTQRQLCRQMGLSSYTLRRRLDKIGAEIETIRRVARSESLHRR